MARGVASIFFQPSQSGRVRRLSFISKGRGRPVGDLNDLLHVFQSSVSLSPFNFPTHPPNPSVFPRPAPPLLLCVAHFSRGRDCLFMVTSDLALCHPGTLHKRLNSKGLKYPLWKYWPASSGSPCTANPSVPPLSPNTATPSVPRSINNGVRRRERAANRL